MTFAGTSPSEAASIDTPALQRARGACRIAFRAAGGRTLLDGLYQRASLKVRLPRHRGREAEAVLINTSGGLTGGDRFSAEVALAEGAEAVVTTQACERVYRSLGGPAEVSASLTVAAGATLAWLPQETILFDRGELRRSLAADLAPGATFLATEAVVFGRTAMGETVATGSFRDRWRVRRAGRLVFADDVAIGGDVAALLSRTAILDGARAMATVLYVGDDADRHLDAVRAALGDDGGASAWNGKLLARVTAPDGLALRRRLIPALLALRGDRGLPRVWQL